MTPAPDPPIEVAIIGSGCAAVSAAFELTRPEQRGRYRVTIYQEGWRFGGKGASGRGPGRRIEEHGLHIWMGFYENAFLLLRECLAELDRDPTTHRFARFEDLFFPDPVIGVVDRRSDAGAANWLGYFPPGAGTPGDPDQPARAFSVGDYLVRLVQLVQALLLSAGRAEGASFEQVPSAEGASFEQAQSASESLEPGALLERIARLLRYGQLATLSSALHASQILQIALRQAGRIPRSPLLGLLDLIGRAAESQLAALVERDDELRRIHELVDLILAVVRGAVRFELVSHPEGFDAINDYEWREWLRMNGAQESSLNSSFVLSLYNLPFAYEGGDPARPRAAAGDALRCCVRAFLTYRGSFFWKMRTGMGDAVFEPFYAVLKQRGVHFRFFHRLTHVSLADPGRSPLGEPTFVESLDFEVQAETRSGGEYQPLLEVDGVHCWPSEPDWSQLWDGERMRREGRAFECFWDRRHVARRSIRVGEDFDMVVLGVGIGAIPHVASELVARDPRWAEMVREVKTTATQAFQLWLREPAGALGWPEAAVNVTGIDGAFETWADMSHLIPEERMAETPKSVAYFCASLPTSSDPPGPEETGYPAAQRERVRRHIVQYLDREIGRVWPRANPGGEFRWDLLIPGQGPDGGNAEARGALRLESQFWTANVSPSARYTLCLPGSARHRISPLDHAVDNLTIAGDWTACGLNVGCVEAAVMSGRLAAHALSGAPALSEITGYDHP